jgi:predicted PurR-regulated permease PerM
MSLLRMPRDRALVLILVLAGAIVFAALPVVTGLLGAGVLYAIFVRPYTKLAGRIGSGFASILALIAAVVVVALPLASLAALVIHEAPDALASVQSESLLQRARGFRLGPFAVGLQLVKVGESLASWLPAQLLRFAGSAASAALNVVIALFGLYFMLRSGGRMWRAVRDYIPFSTETTDELRARFFAMTEAVLVGWLLVAIMQGAVVALGFVLARLPDPIFWGAVTALSSVIPVVGSGLVWAPTTIVLAVQGRYAAALIMLGTGAVAGSVDNVIRLFVYRRVSNIHPMITLVGVFIGIRYFGVLGLLIGPLAIAYLFELLRAYRRDYGGGREEAATISTRSSRVA